MKGQKRPEWARSHHSKKRRTGDRRERGRLRAIHHNDPEEVFRLQRLLAS